MYYISADCHFSHWNIIKYCNRPFKSVGEMNDTIIKNFNSVIKPDDIFYNLGDFCMGDKYDYIASLINRLNGRKVFIRGNHDKVKILNQLKEDKLIEDWHDIFATYINGQYIVMCHYPMRSWDKSSHGSWHTFGHVHSRFDNNNYGLSCDVGVDSWNYFPVSFDMLSKKMALRKAELEATQEIII